MTVNLKNKKAVNNLQLSFILKFAKRFFTDSPTLLNLYGKLAEAEAEIANGAQGEDFSKIAKQLRDNVHGKV
jgi:hypothetical protein